MHGFLRVFLLAPSSTLESAFLISRTTSKKHSSLFTLVFADTSMKGQPHSAARDCASSVDTSLSSTRSHLFPASTLQGRARVRPENAGGGWTGFALGAAYIGTESMSFARRIFSLNTLMSSKVLRFVSAKTSRNPLPSRIHWSCIELYSS